MKKINKIMIVGLLAFFFANESCETTDLDLTENPNALSQSQADPDLLLNGIQEDFARVVESFGRTGAEVTRIDYMFGRDYRNAYQPTDFDGEWEDAYAEIIADLSTMTNIAEASGLNYHVGMGQFIKAYTLVLLVDMFGDIPNTEANQGADNFSPAPDAGADVYSAAMTMLDNAITNFSTTPSAEPAFDLFYGNNPSRWIKACNTLKMKMYMQTRLVDASALSNFNAIVSTGNYISSTSDDLQFSWGTNEVQPDTRHPRYTVSYTTVGGDDYMSNWLMNYMLVNEDPRIRYYYYRQNDETPGAPGVAPDEETLDCSLQTAPPHLAGFPFCSLPDGYWGRDHGNDFGIPPDGFLRTLVGVYPAAGKFDDDTFAGQSQGDGAGGNGITPILLSSTSDFLIAEAAMVNNDPMGAKTAILDGLDKSVNKVQTFGALDASADLTFAPSATDISDHMTLIENAFDNATTNEERWNVLAEEFFVSLYGNGIDAYNFYRRTGYPTTLQPNLEPNPGSFIRSFFYPANAANNNSNITQKPDQIQQVFWDNNPASPSFPIAN